MQYRTAGLRRPFDLATLRPCDLATVDATGRGHDGGGLTCSLWYGVSREPSAADAAAGAGAGGGAGATVDNARCRHLP